MVALAVDGQGAEEVVAVTHDGCDGGGSRGGGGQRRWVAVSMLASHVEAVCVSAYVR